MFETLDAVIENQTMRIQTGVLNEILAEAVAMQQPPSDRGRRLKIFYMTQVAVKPPTFVIFVNDKELMHFSYTRYLENKIRDAFDFGGTPLKFIVRAVSYTHLDVYKRQARACLKKYSCNLYAPLCGILCQNSVDVARCGALIRTKSPTNCDAHLAESLFQTRSRE